MALALPSPRVCLTPLLGPLPLPGLHPGAFRLELQAPPPADPGSSSSGSKPAAAPPSSGGPGSFGHFSLAVQSTAAVLDALRASGQAGLILQECAAVTPVRARGHTQTVRRTHGVLVCWHGVHPAQHTRSRWCTCTCALHSAGPHQPDT